MEFLSVTRDPVCGAAWMRHEPRDGWTLWLIGAHGAVYGMLSCFDLLCVTSVSRSRAGFHSVSDEDYSPGNGYVGMSGLTWLLGRFSSFTSRPVLRRTGHYETHNAQLELMVQLRRRRRVHHGLVQYVPYVYVDAIALGLAVDCWIQLVSLESWLHRNACSFKPRLRAWPGRLEHQPGRGMVGGDKK
eukprot:6636827-Prymnesium_polylepis.2